MKFPPHLMLLAGASSILLWGGVAAPSYALSFGNLSATPNFNTNILNSNYIKAVSFTPTGQDYTLDNVILKLSNYSDSSVPVVEIRNDDGGPNPGSTVLTGFTNPTGLGTSVFNYTFNPTNSITLAADTTYWLYVTSNASSESLFWIATSGAGAVPTGFAEFGTYRSSGDGGASFGSSSTYNHFEINATAVSADVPFEFESSVGLFGFLGTFVVLRKLKTKKNRLKLDD